MTLDLSPQDAPAGVHRRDRGFLTRNPWGVRRERGARSLLGLAPALCAVALVPAIDPVGLAALVAVVVLVAARSAVEVRREGRRGWVVEPSGSPASTTRHPAWRDPSGEWRPAPDSLVWRPLRLLIALVPVGVVVAGLVHHHGRGYFVATLVLWAVLVHAFRHVPTGSRYDVAHHCGHCGRHGAHALCRRCGHVTLEVRPPTEFGSLRRGWRFS